MGHEAPAVVDSGNLRGYAPAMHHTISSKSITLVLGLCLVAAGCGRDPIQAPIDSAPADGPVASHDLSGPDLGAAADLGPDGQLCLPGCPERCKLVADCGLLTNGAATCLTQCPGWAPATVGCLDGLICSGKVDCKQAVQCITAPPLPDLLFKSQQATVQQQSVLYSATICNAGALPSGPFIVAQYLNSATPPKPGTTPEVTAPVGAGLMPGVCQPITIKHEPTPAGNYTSWLRIDAAEQVLEADETNNLAGPIKVEVKGPTQPDLTIKSFDAKINGAAIDYTVEVCNVGNAKAGYFRLDVYYKRALAPSTLMVGDFSTNIFFGLQAGACQTVKHSYTAPVGSYNSWAQVDTLGSVKESNEKNNVAGPRFVLVTAQSGCVSMCTFATSCGLFKVLEFSQCLSWCSAWNATDRKCAEDAQQKKSCADLKACNLPTAPPPPPPPWACLQICNHLTKTCKLLPADQNLTCIGACITMPQTKVQCAVSAMNKGQCLQVSLCIL